MILEHKITPKDIYGTDTPELPEGWELTGEFRPWVPGDYFLNSGGKVEHVTLSRGFFDTPRLILRRKKVRKVIFTEIRRDSQPEKGDWFLDSSGRYGQWNTHEVRGFYFPPTTIYRREDVEE